MTFDPTKHRGNGSLQQQEPTPQPEQPEPDYEDAQSWGYLDETTPEMPEEWLAAQAPDYSDAELARLADQSEEVDEPDDEKAGPQQPKPERKPASVFIENPKPKIPKPFVQYLFNMNTINEINAGPGVGKTTLLSMLAACVATGRPFLDAFMVKRGISVFFTEDAETVTNCLSAWQLEWGENILDHVLICEHPAALTDTTKVKTVKEIGPDGREVERVVQLDRPVWGENALRQIRQIKDFAGDRQVCMVVYDSKSFHLSSAERNGKPLDENSNDDQQYITFCGYRFALALGACGIFIPHVSKEAERSPYLVLESRGGGAAKGAVWKTFSLTQDKTQPDKIIMAAGKRRGGGIAQLLRLTKRTMQIFPDDEAEAHRAEYLAEFEDSIRPAQPLKGLNPIDPLFCGGYLNSCELVDEATLAAELVAMQEEQKKAQRGDAKNKPDPRLTRPSNSEQDVIDFLMARGGQHERMDTTNQMAERTAKTPYQIKRSIENAIKKQLIRSFINNDGEEILTANDASPPPLAER